MGDQFACALIDAKVYCTGVNNLGQLGDGTFKTTKNVMPVSLDQDITTITAGQDHACALATTGGVWCWGFNREGELGDGTATFSSAVPVPVDTSGVLAGKMLTAIAASKLANTVTCAIDTAGQAYCWGTPFWGQLGDGMVNGTRTPPVAVSTSGALAGRTLATIDAGVEATCAADTTGAMYCWGSTFGVNGLADRGKVTMSAVPVATAPSAPLGVTAAHRSGSAVIAWAAPGLGSGVTGDKATAAPGGASCATTGLSCTITGLTSGDHYRPLTGREHCYQR